MSREYLRPLDDLNSIKEIERQAVNKALIELAEQLQVMSEAFAGFPSDRALQKVGTFTEVIQLINTKIK